MEAVVEKSMRLPGNQHMFTDTLAQGGQVFNSPNLYSRRSHTGPKHDLNEEDLTAGSRESIEAELT